MERISELLQPWWDALIQSQLFQSFLSLTGMEEVAGFPLGILVVILFFSGLFLIVAVRTLFLAINLGRIARRSKKQKNLEIKGKLYEHLWSEYSETLHGYQRPDGGEELRATLPAEAFFTREALVDNRFLVWNDFFRHLPGILTGLGIVGTFSGLISGLEGFAPSEEAGAARESLTNLLGGVQEAFHVSAFAIAAAIIVTILEKSLLAWAYKNVEKITHALDARYKVGAGEDYLKRMVEADESNVAQMTQLRDALVNDLKSMLQEMTERQINAQLASSKVFTDTLKKPLDDVAKGLSSVSNVVQGGAQANTDVMKSALDDLMAAFIERMDETLSTNMTKVADSMEKSAQTMTGIQQSMDAMIGKIADTSSAAMSGMVEKLETAMSNAANNQTQMAEQMRHLVDSLREQINQERTTSQQATKEGLDELLDHIRATSAAGQNANDQAITALMERLNVLTQDIGITQEGNQARLTAQFDSLLQQVGFAVTTMEQNITQLRNTTTDAIGGMNRGATTLQKAATDFATAGQSVTGVLDKAAPLANQMQNAGLQMSQSGETMRKASEQLSGMFERYQSVQKTTNDQVDHLRQLIASAQNETGIRDHWIHDLEQAAKELRVTEKHSQEHLNSINASLEKAFKAFGESMTKAVKDSFTSVNSTIEGLNGVAQLFAEELDQKRR